MRIGALAALLATLGVSGVGADSAGEFDYYVMSLSWSPNWCVLEGDHRDAEQCDPKHDFGWTLHGLWPQYEQGYPSDCPTAARNPSRRETGAMADIMGSGGLAWYQWKKHGRCSGLSAQDYFALSRQAYESVERPAVLRGLGKPVTLPASVVEDAFIDANPDLSPDMLTVTCRSAHIQEVRICLTRDLEPRACSMDIRRDCSLSGAMLEPIR
ncbi:ribonuclease T2 family protein [Qingshengfaniella alkalisoli]|uniref:Ribonuclease T n=1 Tax=Qingshengfaniella alkalisoli TaxID=2599296 RepID=A0A5B8IVU4_9RHOB|nr:ribonuclease T2 [Qingshengfaniella alkalisoli]QDY68618.1 ribonuclease T [Qingshengfaniella alkalisoli]